MRQNHTLSPPTMTTNNSLLWSTATTLNTTNPSHFDKISKAKLLLVGSGGIGCELLKNLSLSGFQNVKVIDLDTIDVSNLNRQFLFRSKHVGMSKCEVATAAAVQMSPFFVTTTTATKSSSNGEKKSALINYEHYHGNVKDEQFNINFFKQFDVVLNALDNVDARRHVNRLCLASEVPLVEAGTTGYLGQTTVIAKGQTECYECQPKPTQKVYPICTIRSTPSQPVHCIVWAKELFALFFYHGEPVDKSMLYEDPNGEEGGSTYMDIVVANRPSITTTKDDDDGDGNDDIPTKDQLMEYTLKSLEALFITEINKQLGIDKYKGAKNAPQPLELNSLQIGVRSTVAPSLTKSTDRTLYDSTVWSTEQCAAQILKCVEEMYLNHKSRGRLREGNVEFDKDDPIAMNFVTAACNLRASVFGKNIPDGPQTLHDAKGIAGNIVPAIATTNAIVAGLQILEVFKILTTDNSNDISKKCKYIYCLRDKTRKGFYLQPTALVSPSPSCYVCKKSSIHLTIDTESWTLNDLILKVIKKRLGFNAPTILMGDSAIYEEGEDADELFLKNLPKSLTGLPCGGMKDGTSFTVEDFTQDMEVDVIIQHRDGSEWDEKKDPDGFVLGGQAPVAKQHDDGTATGSSACTTTNDDDKDDEIEVLVLDEDNMEAAVAVSSDNSNKKRGAEEDLNSMDLGAKKRTKITSSNDDHDDDAVVVLD